MIAFTIIILICILALGVSLLVSHWSNGAKSEETVRIDTLYKKNWISFFWISLRVLSLALVTAFLFLMLLASFAGDDAGECCFWIMIFVVGSWFISIPLIIIYFCSLVQAIRHRDNTNKVFLVFHGFNVLQLLCIVILGCLPISFWNLICCHCCHSLWRDNELLHSEFSLNVKMTATWK